MSSSPPYLEVDETTAEQLGISPDTKFAVIQKNESLVDEDASDVPVFVLVPYSGPDAVKLARLLCSYLNESMEITENGWQTKGNDCIRIPFRRASGDIVCKSCGKKYYDHPMDDLVLSGIDKKPFLNVLCNGDRVKL